MKTLEIKINKAGNKVAIVKLNNGNFLVYIQKCNYSRGKNVFKWFPCLLTRDQKNNDFQNMVKEGLSFVEAEKLFKKKGK